MNEATGNQTNGIQTSGEEGAVSPSPPGYDLLDEIGRGGMGVVYRARDLELDREVAVKLLQERYAPESSTAARFVEEARITAQLQHPGIPAVYRVGVLPDARPFLAMKLIKGQTLDTLLKANASIDPLAVFEAVAQAVGYAHAHGVLHRDLKPANVMVGNFGEVQVMDWGLAKVLGGRALERPGGPDNAEATVAQTAIRSQRDSETPFTQYGSVLGTPAYMAPEQAAGELEKIDCRSDVFGLGAILCVLLTGQPPYTGKDADSVRIAAVRGKTEEAFARLDASGADPDAAALCKRCLAFEPSDRPTTADEVASAVAALRLAADERANQAERDRMAAEVRAAEQAKRRRLTLWAAGTVAAVLLLGIAGTIAGLLREKDARELAVGKQKEAEAERDQKEKARVAEEAAKQKAIRSRKFAELKQKEAEDAREVATQQRRLALDTIRDVLLRVDDLMKNDVRLMPLRLEIIHRMLVDVDRIRDHALKNPLEDRTEALAYTRIGEIYFKANRITDGALWLRKAYAVVEKAAKDAADDPITLRNLAASANQLADAEWRLGNGTRSRDLHAFALELRRRWLKIIEKRNDPQKEIEVASAQLDIAESLAFVGYDDLCMGDPVSAIQYYTASEKVYGALPPPLPNFLKVRRSRNEIKVRLGYARSCLGQLEAAEKHYRDALADRERMVQLTQRPSTTVILLKTDVAQSRMFVGDFLLMFRKNRAAANVEYTACAEVFASLLKEDPDSLDLRQRLAATHYRLGLAATDPKKGKAAYAECLKLRKELAEIDPKDTQAGTEVAGALARAGESAEAERVAASLLRQAGKDRQVLFQVACALSIVSGTTTDRQRADRCRDQAFQVLRDLVKAGWKDRAGLETDADLDAIREDPRFKALLKALPKPAEVAPAGEGKKRGREPFTDK
jgi:tetratricopeptide (TPR) repeat protein